MRDIDVAELRSSLTTYLDLATAGETIIIRSHENPFLKLIRFTEEERLPVEPVLARTETDFTEEQLSLAAKGIVTLPKQRMDWEAFWKMPRPKVTGNALTQALLDEREEGR